MSPRTILVSLSVLLSWAAMAAPAAAYEPTVPPWVGESLEHPPGMPPPPSAAPSPSAPPEEAPADETPPQTVSDGIKATSGDHSVKLLFSSTEESSTFTCRLDGRRAFSCESPLVLRHLQRGAHKVTVAAVDSAGNTDPTPVRFHFRTQP